jgi:hypothetical protein
MEPGLNAEAFALERMVVCAAGMSIGAGKGFGEAGGGGEVDDGSFEEGFG